MTAVESTGNVASLIPVLVAAVGALPVLLSPIVAWLLGRSKFSRQLTTIDYLNKRLDLLERASKLQASITPGPVKELLDVELAQYKPLLQQPSIALELGQPLGQTGIPSRVDRFFLTAPATTTRQRVFKGLFYFFFAFSVIGLLTPLALLSEPEFKAMEMLPVTALGSIFYLLLALACRRAAK